VVKSNKGGHNRGARYDAYHRGLIHYNGAPCKKCGNTLRFTTNYSCINCESKRIKRKNKVYKTWEKSESGRMGIATFRKEDIVKKIEQLSGEQLTELEKKIDMMLTNKL
tara:strand:+ start:676 stop:1002 length:327 start_codon:yes stop_codon:yes gene_type:complete